MTSFQKTLITAALVAAFGIGIHQTRRAWALQKQLSGLQQQQAPLAQQLAADRDEALRLQTARRAPAERDTNMLELLRLRGEVARLRREAQEFARSNANRGQPVSQPLTVVAILVTNLEPNLASDEQIRASLQTRVGDVYNRLTIDQDVRALYGSGLFTDVRVVEDRNGPGVTLTYVVKERGEITLRSFANAGTATPEAAFETFLWAAQKGDSNLLSQLLWWRKEKEDAVSDELANRITAGQTRGVAQTFSNLAGVRILGQIAERPGIRRMRVEFSENNGQKHLGEIYMLWEGAGWKPTITLSRREGGKTVSSQFLLPTTPGLGPAN